MSAKHYAVNSQETQRTHLDEQLSQRAARELYLRGFEIAVRESNPWTIMASYNQVNGQYSMGNHDLLTKILRDDWGYKGIVMTDWIGIRKGLRTSHNVSVLYDAIKFKQLAVLKNYSSPHGRSQKNRMVEPFLLMNNNNEVRCYEPESGMNKTFKLSRMEDVELLDIKWSHEHEHRRMYTDIFMFSSEEQLPVSMRMGRLAYNILREEYPTTAKYITPDGDDHWLLAMPVCSYVGITRFVLGLFEDIEVLGSDEFIAYLHDKIKLLSNYINK